MDYSVIVSQGEGTPEAPGGPPHGGIDPQMGDHIAQIEQLSRIRRLNNVDLIHSRCLRMNFRDDYHDDGYVHNGMHPSSPYAYPENDGSMGPPPPAYRSLPPGPPPPQQLPRPPPPPPRHMPRGLMRPPPPRYMPPGLPAPGYDPPEPPLPSNHYPLEHPPLMQQHGGPPGGFFVDENPNACAVM